jgi:hypothetical protein
MEDWFPFIGDNLIETIEGEEIRNTLSVHTLPDGTLAGTVKLTSGRIAHFFSNGSRLLVL